MNNNQSRRDFCATAIATILASGTSVRAAEKKYDPGASDTEIKIGQTVPHSGPGSLYGVLGRVGEAYFQMLNESGGINGRQVKFLTMDDAYSAPKCVEATRRLVEQEQVAFIFNSLGTPSNAAIRPYLNENKVPQLFVATGATKFGDPKNFPWTMGWQPTYQTEAGSQGRDPLPERRFRTRLPRAVQEGTGRCRWQRQGDPGADLRSDRSDRRFPDHQFGQVGRGRLL